MLGIGLVLNTLGICLFCWLIFEPAVYAGRFSSTVSIGMMVFRSSGAAVAGALFVGMASGGLTLVIG